VTEVNDRVSELLVTQAKDDLKGVIEIGRDGPIIVTKKKLSHYASIGLILYALREYQASSREITKRLAASGKKVTVPARLHEMRKRGHIFKPVDRAPYYKLSTRGVKWIEEEVLPPLKKK
jgi:predicted transcriptional regulator